MEAPRRSLSYLMVTIGVAVVGLAALILVDQITTVTLGYDRMGPRLFPALASLGLILAGVALSFRAWRGEVPEPDEDEADWARPFDVRDFAIALAGLVAAAALLLPAGFVVAATVLFVTTATALGDRRPWLTLPVAVLFVLATYLLFTGFLGLNLPQGIVPL